MVGGGITLKHFGKMLLIFLWIILVLGFGYYTVFNNLGSLISPNHTGFSCCLVPEGVQLRSGGSVAVVKLRSPLQFKTRDDQWLVQSSRGTISFSFAPRLRIQWKKSDQGRSSQKNGE